MRRLLLQLRCPGKLTLTEILSPTGLDIEKFSTNTGTLYPFPATLSGKNLTYIVDPFSYAVSITPRAVSLADQFASVG